VTKRWSPKNSIVVRPFIERYLEPGESLGEVIFGLIMLLTFTLGASVLVALDRGTALRIIVAAIGCNLAWGIIDAAMYVMGSLFRRARLAHFHRLILEAPSQDAAIAAVRQVIERQYGDYGRAADIELMAQGIYEQSRQRPRVKARVTRDDLVGALIVFGLVAGPSLPPALPFFFVDDPFVAIRLSNAILIGMLFLAGFRWAHHTDANPWWAGGLLAFFSVTLVTVAIALGG
jgi:hypothetical protein